MNRHIHWHHRETWLERHGRTLGAAIIVASSMAIGAGLAWWLL